MSAWLFLFAGIVTEVIGTVSMRALIFDYPLLGQAFATMGISCSYYFVAKAVVHIPLGITYAVWCGAGLGGIALLSWILFGEAMPPLKIAGLITVGIGMLMLNYEKKKES